MTEEVMEEVEAETATEETSVSEEASDSTEESTEDSSNWRELIQDEKLRKHAERFTTPDALVQANVDFRQKVSKAVVLPSKNASEDEVSSFRKALGVPDSEEGYDFPQAAEGEELPEETIVAQKEWGKLFQDNNVSKTAAKNILDAYVQLKVSEDEMKIKADEVFANETRDYLKSQWKEEYDKNLIIASKAGEQIFGDMYDDVKTLETKDGKFVLDHPAISMAFAKLGREMGEGVLGESLSDDQKDSLKDQVDSARSKRNEAHASGNNKEARKWDQRERELLEKLYPSG